MQYQSPSHPFEPFQLELFIFMNKLQDRELMNTAVLTGRQVYKTMKVFIVSQSGKVADITLQSSCHSEDESVIKVSH